LERGWVETGRPYERELADLPATLALVDRSPVPEELAELVVTLRGLPSTHVGSGGALAVARFASTLCTEVAGRVSTAMTAMAFCEASVTAGCTVLFSASVGHHDIAAAAACAREHLRLPLFLVTLREADSLPASLRGEWIRTVELRGAPPDGFLATNSVLLVSAWLAKAFAEAGTGTPGAGPLPDLGTTSEPARLPAGKSLLVLHGYRTEAVALDLETRLQETGLRTVQTVDYRNFAHGRHVGLNLGADQTTVVALIDDSVVSLAEETLRILPPSIDRIELRARAAWPWSVPDLLLRSMHLVGGLARAHAVDPGRPEVSQYGRRLYHLPILASRRADEPAVIRKMRALGASPDEQPVRSLVKLALQRWREDVSKIPVGAVVLDFDGTCCFTHARHLGTDPRVRTELVRLLDEGLLVGLASGRGRSLHADLRAWIPQHLWDHVALGLYNGGLVLGLGESLVPTSAAVPSALRKVRLACDALGLGDMVQVDERPYQVSITVGPGISVDACRLLLEGALVGEPTLNILASSHSVDVVPGSTNKMAVMEALDVGEREFLAVGDRGDPEGNDFELLNAVRWSLSVDRVSAALDRCWNLSPPGRTGPSELGAILAALTRDPLAECFRFAPAWIEACHA
jgi:hypothetical protein